MRIVLINIFLITFPQILFSQGKWDQKFEQLGTTIASPNNYRTASGAPGIDYWQQKADHKIKVEIDDVMPVLLMIMILQWQHGIMLLLQLCNII